jgi:hypothetical protein
MRLACYRLSAVRSARRSEERALTGTISSLRERRFTKAEIPPCVRNDTPSARRCRWPTSCGREQGGGVSTMYIGGGVIALIIIILLLVWIF